MVRLFKKVTSQIPPPNFGGAAPAAPGGPMAIPTAAPGGGTPTNRQEIGSPLDSLSKILYDVDIKTYIANNFQKQPDEISLTIWQMYGGDKDGLKSDPAKVGERTYQKGIPQEQIENEENETENARWKRLPTGKHILDIVNNKQELDQAIAGVISEMVSEKGGGGPGGGGLGGPPPGGGSPAEASIDKSKLLSKYAEIKSVSYESDDSPDTHKIFGARPTISIANSLKSILKQ